MAISTQRFKNWFITINKGAPSYDKLSDILQEESNCSYAYILHDKDNLKQEHFHVVLMYNNARTFSSVQKRYTGAHIEPCEYVNSTIQYLIHLNNPEKEQYTIYDVHSNCDIASYFQALKEPFNPDSIVSYYKEGTTSILAFYARFGAQIEKHLHLIRTIIGELDSMNVLKSLHRE